MLPGGWFWLGKGDQGVRWRVRSRAACHVDIASPPLADESVTAPGLTSFYEAPISASAVVNAAHDKSGVGSIAVLVRGPEFGQGKSPFRCRLGTVWNERERVAEAALLVVPVARRADS